MVCLYRVLVCISTLLIYKLIYTIFNQFSITIDEKYVTNHNEKLPLILLCTDFYDTKFMNERIMKSVKNCNFQCQITDNFSYYPDSDVAVFHARNMVMKDIMYSNKNMNRLNVFYSIEAFPHEKFRRKHFPKNFFNVTMSFRRDSTIWKPYDWFEPIKKHEKFNDTLTWTHKALQKALSKKTKLAVQFVSHCETHSLREHYVERLQKYTNISTYGLCVNKTIKNEKQILENHFFYLAFENAVCKDYITEKFWRIKNLIVPIVLKRSLLKGIVDDKYFIAADDFDSPKALIDRLIYLSKNIMEYKKYLRWTTKYRKTPESDEREFCKLCEMAVKKQKYEISDIYHWWENESQCQFNYLKSTIFDYK